MLLGEAAGFVLGSGVVGGEEAGQRGFGVVGGHADGVVESFAFTVVDDGVGMDLPEGDPGGDGPGVFFEGFDVVEGVGVGRDQGGGERLGKVGLDLVEAGLGVFGDGGGPLLGRVGDAAVQVVGDGGVAVEGVEAVVGSQVAEEVLLTPAGEHGVGHEPGCVAAGGHDVGLVAGVGIEAGDLAAGEETPAGSVPVEDPHPAVAEQVVVVSSRLVGVSVLGEGPAGFAGEGLFAVGEDVEAVGHGACNFVCVRGA